MESPCHCLKQTTRTVEGKPKEQKLKACPDSKDILQQHSSRWLIGEKQEKEVVRTEVEAAIKLCD